MYPSDDALIGPALLVTALEAGIQPSEPITQQQSKTVDTNRSGSTGSHLENIHPLLTAQKTARGSHILACQCTLYILTKMISCTNKCGSAKKALRGLNYLHYNCSHGSSSVSPITGVCHAPHSATRSHSQQKCNCFFYY